MAPRPFSPENVEAQKAEYAAADQGQVHKFYDSLSEEEKKALYLQLEGFDPLYINKIAQDALNPPKKDEKPPVVEPLPDSATASILDSKPEDVDKWYKSGLELIGQSKVAVVLMAGGQGTRLGDANPKGMFNIGLPSAKSLFQIQAERIRKVQELAGNNAVVPWYVMTSGPTRGPTEAFFKSKNYFGLDENNVGIFEQGVLPCISNEGKIMLDSKAKVAVAPDGNGGIYKALREAEMGGTTVVEDMKRRGIQHIHAYCVDNCLAKVADPVFIGFSAEKKAHIATKVVRKRNATESVGLILLKNGKPDVVEYSEIDSATAEAEDPKQPDVLKFRAANIVNHYYSFDFLTREYELPHHIARKKIPCVDIETGQSIKPEKPNGIKLEQFVFDVFPMLNLKEFACMEVKREDEFSPLKNKAPDGDSMGEDNAKTSRRDIMAQGKSWLARAGATVENGDADGLEVSPLTSYAGEGMDTYKGKTVTEKAI